MDKKSHRRECLALLESLGPAERESFSNSIGDLIGSCPDFRNARTVLSYSALPGEPDLRRLTASCPEKQWAFPKVTDRGDLSFLLAPLIDEMTPGHFGIREPDPAAHQPVSYPSVDLILVPGVGFDPETGARLGRGKGYYDKFLASHYPPLPGVPRPLVIGVCFSIQLSTLEVEPHDFPMHRVVSERGWHNPG